MIPDPFVRLEGAMPFAGPVHDPFMGFQPEPLEGIQTSMELASMSLDRASARLQRIERSLGIGGGSQ